MVVFPNAKINLGLNVLAKRPDGYHNLESFMIPIPLYDILEIIPADSFSLTITGSHSVPVEDNLVTKAYTLLKEDFDLPPVQIHLHKNIPAGGGLGGGSSDASFALKMLNSMFELGLDTPALENYAAGLGSDCPFFITNETALVSGTGTIMQPMPFTMPAKYLFLVLPGIHIPTKEAFSNISSMNESQGLFRAINEDPKTWKNTIFNDFEHSIFPLYPMLERIKSSLYINGAMYASMSGSGSTMYGFFHEKKDIDPGFAFQWLEM